MRSDGGGMHDILIFQGSNWKKRSMTIYIPIYIITVLILGSTVGTNLYNPV